MGRTRLHAVLLRLGFNWKLAAGASWLFLFIFAIVERHNTGLPFCPRNMFFPAEIYAVDLPLMGDTVSNLRPVAPPLSAAQRAVLECLELRTSSSSSAIKWTDEECAQSSGVVPALVLDSGQQLGFASAVGNVIAQVLKDGHIPLYSCEACQFESMLQGALGEVSGAASVPMPVLRVLEFPPDAAADSGGDGLGDGEGKGSLAPYVLLFTSDDSVPPVGGWDQMWMSLSRQSSLIRWIHMGGHPGRVVMSTAAAEGLDASGTTIHGMPVRSSSNLLDRDDVVELEGHVEDVIERRRAWGVVPAYVGYAPWPARPNIDAVRRVLLVDGVTSTRMDRRLLDIARGDARYTVATFVPCGATGTGVDGGLTFCSIDELRDVVWGARVVVIGEGIPGSEKLAMITIASHAGAAVSMGPGALHLQTLLHGPARSLHMRHMFHISRMSRAAGQLAVLDEDAVWGDVLVSWSLATQLTYRSRMWHAVSQRWGDARYPAAERAIDMDIPRGARVGEIIVPVFDPSPLRDVEWRVRMLMGPLAYEEVAIDVPCDCPAVVSMITTRRAIHQWLAVEGRVWREGEVLGGMGRYMGDLANLLEVVDADWDQPVALAGGDRSSDPCIPTVSKSTVVPSPGQEEQRHLRAIRVDLGGRRHLDAVPKVAECEAGPLGEWKNKKDAVIWRGAATGSDRYDAHCGRPSRLDLAASFSEVAPGLCDTVTEDGVCEVDVDGFLLSLDFKITSQELFYGVPDNLVGRRVGLCEFVDHKIIVSIEGNDVATNLRWAMASMSTVFMPAPTMQTFFMEELLVPWVHFVPIESPDFSDIVDKAHWCLVRNPKACEQIGRNGHIFASAMVDKEVHGATREEVMRRYLKNVKLNMDCPVLGMVHPLEPIVMHRGEHDVRSYKALAAHRHQCACEHGDEVIPATFPPPADVDTALRMSAIVEEGGWGTLWL